MKPTLKTSLARGTRGFLLRSIDDAGSLRYFFRVYGGDHSFCDYELLHSDLEVEIVDDEATFYEAEEGHEARLDHSPRTLDTRDDLAKDNHRRLSCWAKREERFGISDQRFEVNRSSRRMRDTMSYEGIITIEPGKRGGQPCIRGMRITVYDVLSYLAAGMTEQEVLQDFPYLTHEDILACLAYAAEREHRMLVVNE
jgi:uncharacterized protein (DUF433 family)